MVTRKPIEVKRIGSWKAGYRALHDRVQDHPNGKAIRFIYYSWLIWLPARAVLKMLDGTYIVPYQVINNAKEHDSARKCDSYDSARFEAGLSVYGSV